MSAVATRTVLPVVLLLALGCAALRGPDVAAIGHVADVASSVGLSDRGHVVLVGLVDPGVNVVPDACASKLRQGFTEPDPAQRAIRFAEAFDGLCPASCAQDVFASLATADPRRHAKIVEDACDAKGPDPVFGTSPLREDVDGLQYLVARMLIDPALDATEGDPAGQKLRDVLPDVVSSLAASSACPIVPAPGKTEFRASANLDQDALADVVHDLPCSFGSARFLVRGGAVVLATGGEGDGQCVADALKTRTFPTSAGDAIVDVAWGGQTGPSVEDVLSMDEDVPDAGPAHDVTIEGEVSMKTPEVTGSLTADIVRKEVLRHVVQVRYCYQQQLKLDPTARGEVRLELVIGEDGAVTNARATSDLLPSSLTDCVAERGREWKFPAPDDGIVKVAVPFVLRAAGAP